MMIIDCSSSQNSMRGVLTDESLCASWQSRRCATVASGFWMSLYLGRNVWLPLLCWVLDKNPLDLPVTAESGGKYMSNIFCPFPFDCFFLTFPLIFFSFKKTSPGPCVLGGGEIVVKWESSWLSSPRMLLLLPPLLAFFSYFILARTLGDSTNKILLRNRGQHCNADWQVTRCNNLQASGAFVVRPFGTESTGLYWGGEEFILIAGSRHLLLLD